MSAFHSMCSGMSGVPVWFSLTAESAAEVSKAKVTLTGGGSSNVNI